MRWVLALVTVVSVHVAAADPLEAVRDDDPRSIDAAVATANEAGAAKRVAALPALVKLVDKPTVMARRALYVAALRAIGEIGLVDSERARVVTALVATIDRDPPPHPRTATAASRKAVEETYMLHLVTSGAAINAVAQLRAAAAVRPLVFALYRTPELFDQLRRALVRLGPVAVDELRKVLRGEDKDLEKLIATRKLDQYCGARCERVSAHDFYAAAVLGDLRDPAAVPELLGVLAKPPLPAYFYDDDPGPTQYAAAFDALRKLGAPEAAAPLRALWMSPAKDVAVRIGAIAAYPYVTRDDVGLKELAAIASDNGANDDLRREAALAYARIAHGLSDTAVFDALATRYETESAKKRAEADALPRTDREDTERALAAAQAVADAQRAMLDLIRQDPSKSAADIRDATAAVKRAEDDVKVARKRHADASNPYKQLDRMARAYLGFARMFRTHVARIEIAARCKADTLCYAAALTAKTPEVVKRLAPYIKDVATWKPSEQDELVRAQIDRATLELGKRGKVPAPVGDAMLDALVASDDRIVRESIVLALPHVAALPCTACEAKLNAALKAGEGKVTLASSQLEVTMMRDYLVAATLPAPK